jgi:hypothetical protein
MAIRAGASQIIATSVQIRQSHFTNALDDMLVELSISGQPVHSGLRALQTRLLDEWRVVSLRGGTEPDDGWLFDSAPLPDVWANFQSFGR